MDSIFELDLTEEPIADNKQKGVDDKLQELALRLRALNKDKNDSDKEPDWQGQLLNAKNSTEKMHIRAAREAWQDEQKIRVFEALQTAFDLKVNGLLNTPQLQRN